MLSSFMKTFLYEIDFFKIPFILLFKNRKKSSTLLGSFISLSIFAIIIYLFSTSNMVLKINPSVIDQTTTNDHASLISLTPQNFAIAAGVANSFGKGFSDPTIFKVQFIQIEIGFNDTINSKQITRQEIKETIPCSNDSFSDPTTFNTLGLAEYSCLQNGTFELEGGFDERMVKAVVVMISYCDNETDGVVCQSQANINNFFKDKGLWLYYQDDIYDVSNYTVPVTKNWRLQAIQCATVPRIVDLYLKELIFINDDQFVFSNEQTISGFMKERTEALSDYVMVNSPLISINLFSSKNNQKTKRQYQKFGDLLASIGGFINVFIIIGILATKIQNQLQMQNHVMNNLYDFSYDKFKKIRSKNLNTPQKSFFKDHETEKSDLRPNLTTSNGKDHHYSNRFSLKEKKSEESHDFKPVNLDFSEYLSLKGKMILRQKLTTKEKLFLSSEKKFRDETDVVYILKKIQEFEKFKMILLNEKQLGLFNLIAKPLIYLENQRNQVRNNSGYWISNSQDSNREINTKNRLSELKALYSSLSNQEDKSQIDQNLLMLIEKNIFFK